MPGLRAAQKYAVRVGGGSNHRFGLDDAVLIKDNHVAIAGGIRAAVEHVRAGVGHMVKIELEVDTLAQLEQALALRLDAVLLDNMDPAMLRQAVGMVDGRMITEASGGIRPDTAVAIAASGVDLMSIGWLTHSAQVLDIGLDHLGEARHPETPVGRKSHAPGLLTRGSAFRHLQEPRYGPTCLNTMRAVIDSPDGVVAPV